MQADGKIVVAGSTVGGMDYDFALVRYHGNITTGTPGALDTTFNGTGKVITPLGGDDYITSMALQGDGKIVVAGFSNVGVTGAALARYNANGTPDTTFNGTGNVVSNLTATGDDTFIAVAVQADGTIVAVGSVFTSGFGHDFVVARYHGDSATGTPGTLDTAFAGTGKTTVDMGPGDNLVCGVALQGDGKMVIAATVQSNFTDFAVTRFLGDGPAIAVQTAPGASAFDGFGIVPVVGALPGNNTSTTFTIQNTGTANLTGLGITIDGVDSSAFTVTANATSPVTPFASTTFTVRFLPASLGPKNATLHLATNVPGNNGSYDISLSSAGLNVLESWRQQFFHNPANFGNAADNADPYAAGQLPQPQFTGPNYGISFTEPAGVSGVTYSAEWRADLSSGTRAPVADTGSGTTHTFVVPMAGNGQIFLRLKVSSP